MDSSITIDEELTELTTPDEENGIENQNWSALELAKKIEFGLNLLNSSQHVTPDYFIFRIPGNIRRKNMDPYGRENVIIGPLGCHHHISSHLDDDKRRYLASFLLRAKHGTHLKDFVTLIEGSLAKIRGCYEKIYYRYRDDFSGIVRQDIGSSESESSLLIEMILVDAGFILELLLRAYFKEWRVENDLIFAKSGMIHIIKQDLMLLENQLPFFLLRDMYELAFTGNPDFPSFLHLTCHFFNHYYNQNISIQDMLLQTEYRSKLEKSKHFTDLIRTFQQPYSFQKHSINEESRCCKWILRVKHFMDLIRSSLFPSFQKPKETEPEEILEEVLVQGKYLYSAVLLREAGVKFKASLRRCLLDIEFDQNNGELRIPPLRVDDLTELFYGNLLVWEQYYYPNDTYICDYIFLMEYLIKSVEDVDLLVQRRIIINQLGSPKEIVTLFNHLCKYIKVERNRYSGIFMKLNAYNAVRHHSWIAILKLEYFSTLWRGVATIAAIILLVLTMIQTICAIISL